MSSRLPRRATCRHIERYEAHSKLSPSAERGATSDHTAVSAHTQPAVRVVAVTRHFERPVSAAADSVVVYLTSAWQFDRRASPGGRF
jgi:hypothetical protein